MSDLIPLKLNDDTVIYIERDDPPSRGGSGYLGGVRGSSPSEEAEVPVEVAKMQSTLRYFTDHALAPFREVAGANIDKVKLEFGLKIGGEAGLPFITKGSAESTLKVTVECSFPNQDKPESE